MKKNWFSLGVAASMIGALFSMFFNTTNLSASTSKSFVSEKSVLKESISQELDEVNDDKLTFFIPTINKTNVSTCFKLSFGVEAGAKNYMIGYWGEGDEYYPAKLAYTIKYKDGTIAKEEVEVNNTEQINKFIGIGPEMGSVNRDIYCDVLHTVDGEILTNEPLILKNIFEYDTTKEEIDRKPDFNHPLQMKGTLGVNKERTFCSVNQLEKNVNLNYAGLTTFDAFTSFKVNVNSYGDEAYLNLPYDPNAAQRTSFKTLYKDNKSAIDSGVVYVKTRVRIDPDGYYLITYKDGTTEKRKEVADSADITGENTSLFFLLKDIKPEEVANFQIKGLFLNMLLFSNKTGKEISKSNYSMRYGYVDFKIQDLLNHDNSVGIAKINNPYEFNGSLLVALSVGIASVVYLIVSIINYFVSKNKNKHDEFKKMNTKAYWKTNLIGLACIDVLIVFFEMIYLRFWMLSTSLPVFNPTDVFIIVGGVLSILLVGYFIRYAWVSIKAIREKNRNERLKINLDKADDGTIQL